MKKLMIGLAVVCIVFNCLAMDRNNAVGLYIINPKDTTTLYSSNHRSNLLRRFMREAAVTCFTLDEDQELEKVEAYYDHQHEGQSVRNKTKWSLSCPDEQCNRIIQSEASFDMLKEQVMQHWFSTNLHQSALFAYATALIGESKAEAKRNFKEHPIDKNLAVEPFPFADSMDEDDDEIDQLEEQGQANYFILEPIELAPHAYATFFGATQEGVVALYLTSKLREGVPAAVQPVKTELMQRTRKQCLVQQGYKEKSLVCPQSGCMHMLTASGASDALDTVTHAMLVHYLVHHKQDNPAFIAAAALVAPSFSQARNKIMKGDVDE